jgi:hypothetical protein
MKPRFLFFTGEPAVTLPVLKQRPAWSPVLSALRFDVTNGRLHRNRNAEDRFHGVVYFADVRDKEIETHNLDVFAKHSIPCWPLPATLLNVSDRHAALATCIAAGLVDHSVVQDHFTREPRLPFPYVLKIENEHRGEGKYFIQSASDIPKWDGIATMEPFFNGDSVRVLLVDDQVFGIRIHNDDNWIKNAAGATFEPWEPNNQIVEHARKAMSLFDLEIAGIDYVIDRHGFHFIELNPFPRVGLSKESAAAAQRVFQRAMDSIEGTIADRETKRRER